jgi:hypothetical protein
MTDADRLFMAFWAFLIVINGSTWATGIRDKDMTKVALGGLGCMISIFGICSTVAG